MAAGRLEWLEILGISALGALLLLWASEWGRGRRPRALPGYLPLPLDCAIVPRRTCGIASDRQSFAAVFAPLPLNVL